MNDFRFYFFVLQLLYDFSQKFGSDRLKHMGDGLKSLINVVVDMFGDTENMEVHEHAFLGKMPL